jgi:hypothetical protein
MPLARPCQHFEKQKPRYCGASWRVSEGTRTPDRLDHNQELYQLSYAHQERRSLAPDQAEEAPFAATARRTVSRISSRPAPFTR